MQYDITLLTRASARSTGPLPPDVRELRDHLGPRYPRTMELRRTLGAALHRLADRIDPTPAPAPSDALFDAIAALLAEPKCEAPRLKTVSQRGC